MKRETMDFTSTSCVDAFKLIRQVRKNEVLYNKETHGYSDLNGKELVWEDIHRNLFAGYEDFDDETKSTIRKTVRKRWKSLRDCVVKDLKMRTDNPSYIRRKHNPLVDELQFILPFVKKHNHNNSLTTVTYDDQDQQIDLTNDDTDAQSSSMYYPYVKLQTEDFNNSNIGSYSVHDVSDSVSQGHHSQHNEEFEQQNGYINNEPVAKRKKVTSSQFMEKMMDFLTVIQSKEEEEKDEDRMFLLSLLSDFKQILPERKLKVKSEIISAICNGLEY